MALEVPTNPSSKWVFCRVHPLLIGVLLATYEPWVVRHQVGFGRLKALGLKTTGSKAELEARYEAWRWAPLKIFGPSLYEGSDYKGHTLLRLLFRYIYLIIIGGIWELFISPLGVVYKLI